MQGLHVLLLCVIALAVGTAVTAHVYDARVGDRTPQSNVKEGGQSRESQALAHKRAMRTVATPHGRRVVEDEECPLEQKEEEEEGRARGRGEGEGQGGACGVGLSTVLMLVCDMVAMGLMALLLSLYWRNDAVPQPQSESHHTDRGGHTHMIQTGAHTL
jgi:hypothetical protein